MIFYDGMKVYMNGKYPAVFVNGKNQHVHRLQWEKHHGEIPKGYIVHHKDENKLNWEIDNLELLSRSEHLKKHKNIVKRPGVKIIARNGEIEITFRSIDEAAKFCETYPCSIQRICKGTQSQSKGWTFTKGGGHHSVL